MIIRGMSLDATRLFRRGPYTWKKTTRCIGIVTPGWRLRYYRASESDKRSRRSPHPGGLHEGLKLRGLERMRRIDDGYASRPPPFRVLAAPDGNYLAPPSIPPPPPRAPEPYKIAPSSTSSSRAHRRSSFVIIADSRPASPETRSPSPTLATGRASPFRGRGFKGPPPRSKSRPQSPDPADARRRGRNDRRVSVSQQSSPRRSLIPQPTRQRSTSLSKSNERLSSPKFGRRGDSRTRLNTTDSRNRLNAYGNSNSTSNLAARRQVTRTPSKLSPIQGTPTKPEKTSHFTPRNRSKDAARSPPSKLQKVTISPSKNARNLKRPSQEKTSRKATSKEHPTSPSKIPLKTNKVSSNSLNPARFITITDQPAEKSKKGADKGSKEGRAGSQQANGSSQSGKQSGTGSKESQSSGKNSSSADRASNLDLIDLLKQTSAATGTSSVVNTTATTAVQPLHIDANAAPLDKDAAERKNPEKTRSQADPPNSKPSNSSNSDSQGKQVQSSQATSEERSSNPPSSKSTKPSNNYNRAKGGPDSRTDSPVPTETSSSHSKSNSVGQPAKNFAKVNGTGTGSATVRSSRNQNSTNEQTAKGSRSSEQKSDESGPAQTAPATNATKASEAEATNDLAKNSSSKEMIRSASRITSATAKQEDSRTMSKPTPDPETKTAAIANSGSMAGNTVVGQPTTATKANNVSAMAGAVNGSKTVTSAGAKRPEDHGSGTSVKSSTGMSVDSIESVRSTDTGVSVDTVRGVSSPREKTGMHVVKRPQEIETLSGNVVHLEQNGEPTVLTAANGVGERPPDRLLARWKRSLSRCCECWPSMRCLACRTNPKGLAWPRNTSRTTVVSNRNQASQQPATNATEEGAPTGCWPKFKNRCRCKRLREVRCCSRRSRIAPAEAAVCCPPERRFGAICRRVFDNCKCKRNAEIERTRNIRAKHSLTSVAPPPLSEEPKAKIPDVLVEHNSLMRGAIPCLPVPLAWFCLVWNVLLPGSGTVWSGIFNLCAGQPRFSAVAGLKSRLGAFVVNLVVGVGQLFTVLFCLVGWGWSIWWGVTLVRLARKYKRFKASEAASNDPEARGGEGAALPPGVPSQALRGVERAR
ncbi:mechanosensory transduction mediator stumble isoform X2 [Andrena cerasifolii]|uniref:mechanosensory transduction mediator stumble isoform X2 n=1 Tax=Andrena cerasifolii TaxID=2819439 RepID=UPI0040382B39